MEEFLPITDELEALTNENLVCLSTLGCVYLIIDENISSLNINDVLTFIRYIESFQTAFHIQMNIDSGFSVSDFLKIKLLSSKIMLRTYCTNIDNVLSNIKQLENNNISCGLQVLITKENVENVLVLADKLTNKDLSITLYFVEPYVTTNLFVIIQKKFIDAGFTAIQIATCGYSKFNKRKNHILMNTIDCDASRFSIYVENRTIYPCPFKTTTGIKIDSCNSIKDFWHNKKFAKFRKFIIENNYCKTNKN
jgi:MoaA/NifB/PqqE/SkfB family radical SAM enzyme